MARIVNKDVSKYLLEVLFSKLPEGVTTIKMQVGSHRITDRSFQCGNALYIPVAIPTLIGSGVTVSGSSLVDVVEKASKAIDALRAKRRLARLNQIHDTASIFAC